MSQAITAAQIPAIAERLPPFPRVVPELLDSLQSDTLSVDNLVRIARNDSVIAAAILSGANDLRRLRALPGIGDWTVQLIALRALAWPDAFPATDLVLARMLSGGEPDAEPWRPWRAYAAMLLWQSLNTTDSLSGHNAASKAVQKKKV